MRKHIVFIILYAAIAASLSACGPASPAEAAADGGKLSVVASIFAPYDFAREIAGDRADITMLLPPASESHSFEPSPRDIIAVQNCDVFIYVGGESDEWIGGVLESMDTENMSVVTLMDCVDTVEEELVEGMEAEEEEEEGTAYDEHVWTSPRNAKLIVQKISEALCGADAANAAAYRQDTEEYLKKLDALDARFRGIVDGAARRTIVFGDRFPFRYFADEYGLEYFAAFPGCAAETEAGAAAVSFLIDKVKAEAIPAVFHIELGNENMTNAICEATGAKPLLLHACHNISKDDFTRGESYLSLMEKNAGALEQALGRGDTP